MARVDSKYYFQNSTTVVFFLKIVYEGMGVLLLRMRPPSSSSDQHHSETTPSFLANDYYIYNRGVWLLIGSQLAPVTSGHQILRACQSLVQFVVFHDGVDLFIIIYTIVDETTLRN